VFDDIKIKLMETTDSFCILKQRLC